MGNAVPLNGPLATLFAMFVRSQMLYIYIKRGRFRQKINFKFGILLRKNDSVQDNPNITSFTSPGDGNLCTLDSMLLYGFNFSFDDF